MGNPKKSPIDRFIKEAAAIGCPRDQVSNFICAGICVQPKQLVASAAAREADKEDGPTEIGFGGARGGGKSAWAIIQMATDDCQRQPGLKCLFLRKVGKAAGESLNDLRNQLLMGMEHKFSPHKGVVQFPNGSRIITGHFMNEKDIDAYLGIEYDIIAVEEASTLSESKFKAIRTCCRTSKQGWRPRMYATTNPGGIGHAWFKKRFIDPWRAGKETETRFIPSTIEDNRFVNKDYVATLDKLTGWLKKAWRYGEWDIAAGQYYTTFSRRHHVVSDIDERRAVTWWIGFDYGFNHPTTAVLGFWDGDGNCWIVAEHYRRRWLVESHAEAIKEMVGRSRNYQYDRDLQIQDLDWIAAGHDAFAGVRDGRSVADDYKDNGIKLIMASKDRQNGAAEILRLLGDPSNEEKPMPARLFIHERCVQLIEQITSMQHDPSRPEDTLKVDIDDDGNGGDDVYDGFRYGVTYKRSKVRVARVGGR